MFSKLKNCHLTLTVIGKENLFVTSFSGYLKIGLIKNSQVVAKCMVIRVDQFETFTEEFKKSLSFLLDDDLKTYKSNNPDMENISWQGQSGKRKTLSYYKDEKLIFELNSQEFYSFVVAISRSMLFTFLFKDNEISFFQTLLDDCLKQSQSLEDLKKDNNSLNMYIKNYLAQQNASLRKDHQNLNSILKTLFQNYHPILKAALDLKGFEQ